jgi:hypothetical protein
MPSGTRLPDGRRLASASSLRKSISSAKLKSIEALILELDPPAVRVRLLEFVNQYCDYDEQLKDYRHIQFFAEVKARLGV